MDNDVGVDAMKLLILNAVEQQTLREMGVFHTHARVRIRAQAIVRLSQGLTLQQTADEFHVHLNSIEAWRQRWNKQGLMGLYEGHHTGRRRKWTAEQQEALGALAQAEGGSANSLLRALAQRADLPAISEETARRYLHEMQLSYKRYRYSLKKSIRRKLSARPHV
jgi:transposase